MHNKWGRRRKRLEEKHRPYFEEMAAEVIRAGHGTVDIRVTTFDVSLRRRWSLSGRRIWLTIEHVGGTDVSSVEGHPDLVKVITFYLINFAANYPGAQPPPSPPSPSDSD